MRTPPEPRTCSFPDCGKPHSADGLCGGHWRQQWKGQELRPLRYRARGVPKDAACDFPECGRPRNAHGLCKAHCRQLERHGRDALTAIGEWQRDPVLPCAGPECIRPSQKLGLCGGHYAQYRRGVELRPIRARATCRYGPCDRIASGLGLCSGHYQQEKRGRPLGPLWDRQSRARVVADGYILIMERDHPNARKSGYIFEHVKVMSDILGRPLIDDENVHHRNGVKDDNRASNLELWSSSQPPGQRVADKIEWAREILALYADVPEIVIAP